MRQIFPANSQFHYKLYSVEKPLILAGLYVWSPTRLRNCTSQNVKGALKI